MKTPASNLLVALACAGMLAACNRPSPSSGTSVTPPPEAPKVDSPITTPLPPVPGTPMPPPAITPTPTLTPGGTASMSPWSARQPRDSSLFQENPDRAHPTSACLAKQES